MFKLIIFIILPYIYIFLIIELCASEIRQTDIYIYIYTLFE